MDPIQQLLNYIAYLLDKMISSLSQGIGSGISSVNNFVSGLVSAIGSKISDTMRVVNEFLGGIARKIGDSLKGLIDNIAPVLGEIIGRVADALGNVFGPLFATIKDLVDRVKNVISDLLGDIREVLNNLWKSIQEIVTTVFNSVVNLVGDAIAEIRATVERIVGKVVSWITAVAREISGLIQRGIQFIADAANAIVQGVLQGVNGIIASTRKNLDDQQRTIQAAWKQLVTGAESIIESVETRISDLNTAFTNVGADLVKALTGIADDQFAPIRDTLKAQLSALTTVRSPDETHNAITIIRQLTSGEAQINELRATLKQGYADMIPDSPLWRSAFSMIVSIILLAAGILPALQVFSNVALQELAQNAPYQLLQVPEVVATWKIRAIDKQTALLSLRKNGYSTGDAEALLKAADEVPAEGDLVAMLLREIISEEQFNQALQHRGLDPTWQGPMKKLAELIPPPADLITMAVREVFTPAIASAQGQFEDFPEAFAEWAKKQGLSDYWARNYWAAHWTLPSPQQGFEMLQRGVIDEQQLDALLKALDIMPAWRSRLTAIAYNPLTRVDIRRMHKIGVLGTSSLQAAYQAIGYTPEDALRLSDFTVELNKGTGAEDDTELGKLTRSNILGFYEDGLIPRERAFQLLTGIGITAEAATLYVTSVDLSSKRSERKAEADHLVELGIAGSLSFEEAQDRLNRLGLEPVEVDRAVTRLLRALEKQVKLPSRAEGENLFTAGIIDEASFVDLLGRLGYSQKWQGAFLAQAKGKKGDADKS